MTSVKPFEKLGEALAPDGAILRLVRRDEEFLILTDNVPLMSSRMHNSEEELATLACGSLKSVHAPTVLIGGLGMGFTLRATLNVLPSSATVVVAELIPEVVTWNRDTLGAFAGHPLQDPRTQIVVGDVAQSIHTSSARYDAILLDVDNGPAAFTAPANAALYDGSGIAAIHGALKKNGTFTLWSTQEDPRYVKRLQLAGFKVQVHRVRERAANRGRRHTIFVARKSS